jgi:2-aminoadipate transaminase
MKNRGMNGSDELLITAGACQAIDLISRILLDKKTVVVVEKPTYMEALEIFQNYTQQIISIEIDEQGMRTNSLEGVLEERKRAGLEMPRLLYTIPTFQNPTGTTMSLERRKHLLSLAEKYNFLILEDDAYGELSFSDSIPTLKSFDTNGRVLYVGSLSKIVAPGMRIGWVAGRKEFVTALEWFKKDLDHPFAQATMTAFLEKTDLNRRVEMLKNFYRSKCEVLLQSLAEFLPEAASWYVPGGGYFVWVRIPGADTSELLPEALAAGVSYVPGKYFFLDHKDGKEYLRLSFSFASEESIAEGVRRVGHLFKHNKSSVSHGGSF